MQYLVQTRETSTTSGEPYWYLLCSSAGKEKVNKSTMSASSQNHDSRPPVFARSRTAVGIMPRAAVDVMNQPAEPLEHLRGIPWN
jgi:hypothetical protein